MTEPAWTRLMRASTLVEGRPRVADTEDGSVMVVRLGRKLFACGSMCTHYGGPLAKGVIRGTAVVCPWHMAQFDLKNGRRLRPPALDDVPCYRTKVKDGRVWISGPKSARAPKPRGHRQDTFLIAGAGAAGNAAAETLRREGFTGRVLLVTPEHGVPYDRPPLSKTFLLGGTDPADLALRPKDFYADSGIELLNGRRVVRVNPVGRLAWLDHGRPVRFDRLLLATGGTPKIPRIPCGDRPGVYTLRSLADAKRILAALKGVRRVALLGSGFVSMELVSCLAGRGLEVHVITRELVPMTRTFGEEIGRWLMGLHKSNGVRFHLGASACSMAGGRRKTLTLSNGEQVQAEIVIAGLGILPAVSFLMNTGLVVDGAVPVNGRLETGIPGIFAAGDIASLEGRRVEHWAEAERMGAHAARAMLGSRAIYDGPPFFWTRQFEHSIQYAGWAPEFDRVALRGRVGGRGFLAGYYSDGRLKAVAGAGRAKEVIGLSQILADGKNVTFAAFTSRRVP